MTPLETPQELREVIWPAAQEAPSRVLLCRHCGQRNRVDVPTAVFEPDSVVCGACDGALFVGKDAPLEGLPPSAYEHPLDRKSLQTLRALPGFSKLMRWMVATVGERSIRLNMLASNLLVSDEQFPELLELLDRAARRLALPRRPELFLGESPFMNAMTMGVEETLIVVNSAMLDQLSDEEIVCVLGHELGHIHSDHVLYKTMANLVLTGGVMMSGVVRLLTWPLNQALLHWNRCSELTADRAGLLASRDLIAALRTEMKLAGGNRPGTSSRTRIKVGPFIRQARTLTELEETSWSDNVLASMLAIGRSHPLTAWRVMHLLRWVEKGNYLDILAGDYPRVPAKA